MIQAHQRFPASRRQLDGSGRSSRPGDRLDDHCLRPPDFTSSLSLLFSDSSASFQHCSTIPSSCTARQGIPRNVAAHALARGYLWRSSRPLRVHLACRGGLACATDAIASHRPPCCSPTTNWNGIHEAAPTGRAPNCRMRAGHCWTATCERPFTAFRDT